MCAQANVRVSASIDLKTLITTVMRAQVTERTNERCVQSATRQEAQGVKTTTPQLRSAASASALAPSCWSPMLAPRSLPFSTSSASLTRLDCLHGKQPYSTASSLMSASLVSVLVDRRNTVLGNVALEDEPLGDSLHACLVDMGPA